MVDDRDTPKQVDIGKRLHDQHLGTSPAGHETVDDQDVPKIDIGERLRAQHADASPPERERVRGWFAKALFWILVGDLALSWVAILCGVDWAVVKDMISISLPAIVSLLGAVTGFYYGSEGKNEADS